MGLDDLFPRQVRVLGDTIEVEAEVVTAGNEVQLAQVGPGPVLPVEVRQVSFGLILPAPGSQLELPISQGLERSHRWFGGASV